MTGRRYAGLDPAFRSDPVPAPTDERPSEEPAMDVRENLRESSRLKFGIGQPVPRSEDPRLLQGQGRYTDDINLPGQAYATIVRSRQAHGILRGIDADEARSMPGVLGVYTASDVA